MFLAVRSFGRLLANWEHDILKTKELISMQIGRSGPRDESVKRSTLEVSRSKVKRGQH